MDKYNNKITRLLVTGTFNQKIGWANFDSSIHHVGNEDSEHFLAVYQRDNQIGPWFILSIQVVNREFLVNEKNSLDYYLVHQDQGQDHEIDSHTVKSPQQN